MEHTPRKLPMRFAHRGLVQHAPENTIDAFRAAVEYGCEGIELDVRLSKDGVAIVVHDGSMTRMTDGKNTAEICDLTAEEICAAEIPYAGHLLPFHPPVPYSEGEGSSRTFTPEQIAYFRETDTRVTHLSTFEQFDAWFAGVEADIVIEIELCAPGTFRAIYPILKKSPNCGRYIVFSGHWEILEEMTEVLKANGLPEGLRLGANFRQLDDKSVAFAKEAGLYEVGLNDKWFTKEDVDMLREMGVKVFSNLGDYPEWWKALQTLGVEGFKTNYAEAYTCWLTYGKKE
ncbi:MAG: hypothetical protein IK082_03735 [Oscillospiraceae bacterium]|nr:hypothetical protein [Oscillospiraceae bacterium]